MRMRKKKHGAERIAACAHLFYDKETNPFQNTNPVHIEIGCGKGAFITQLAKRNPNINYIAIEKISDVLLLAMEKAVREDLHNIRFLNCDAKELGEKLPPASLARIYLNFSDPWPKKGHAKRRLTYRTFLALYRTLLCEGGAIHQKTDNVTLFESSLAEFALCGYRLENVSYDLHHSIFEEENIHTEYEDHFSSLGYPIHRLEAYL